jgi:hypothetical protein
VSFKKLEVIHEIKEGPQNMNYLLSHVGTKVFHLGAHVYLLNGINFFATPISPWKVSHTI